MKQVTWLLAGAGDIATRRVGPGLVEAKRSRVVGVCDLDGDRAARLAAQLGVEAVYTDLGVALAESGADAVYVATPQSTHIELSLQVLAAGRHLLCEKPLGLTGAACLPLVRAARASDRVVSCSNYRRLSAQYRLTEAMLQRGEIGDVVGGWAVYSSPFYNPSGAPIHRARGASRIKELGYYLIDIVHHFCGLPTGVMARGSILNPEVMHDVETLATVILSFPSGAQFSIIFNCASPGTRHELEVFGTTGRIHWDQWPPHGNGPIHKITGAGSVTIPAETAANCHLPMIQDYVDAVLEGREPVCTLESAAQTEFITDAIFRSLDSGRWEPVDWEPLR